MIKELFTRSVSAEKIQREILTEQDKVVSWAREIVRSAPKKDGNSKAERLIKLGFTSSKEVNEAELSAGLERASRAIQEAEEGAALKYPGFKFVSKDVMDMVLKKYNLIIAGVERYKGEVPDWALGVIERSGVAKEVRVGQFIGFSGNWLDSSVIESEWQEKYYTQDSNHRIISKTNLMIAAPSHEMIVHGNEEVVNGRIKVKDPIVCVEVPHGYVVIAAWGEEGQDPGVFNANTN